MFVKIVLIMKKISSLVLEEPSLKGISRRFVDCNLEKIRGNSTIIETKKAVHIK